jgi:pimeloyl-ACP methyl ester carboxylesterase
MLGSLALGESMHEHQAVNADRRSDLARGDSTTRYPGSENAVDLAYEASGDKDKSVLLLIHGGTASRRAWDLVTPALRANYRIIAVDMRGHGQSPAPDSGYSAVQLSADINRVIDELALDQITVVGHSLGGMAAIFLAAHRSDVVKRLVLVNAPVTPKTIDALTSLEARIHRPGFFPVTQAFVEEWSAHPRPVPTAFLATQRAHIFDLRPVVWQQVFGELAKADITSTLKGVKQPTLILWGSRDGILDQTQYEKLRSGIENARLVMIDEAGHNPSSATPDRVAAEIASFAA